MKSLRMLLLSCLVGLGAFHATSAQTPALVVEPLTSPAGAASFVPQLTVQDKRVVLSWVEREGTKSTLRFAERTAAGWSGPLPVIASDHMMVNSADVPSVRAMPDGSFAAHWMQESGADPEAYDLRIGWSRDGHDWSAPVAPNRDKTVSQHGFATIFPAGDGGTGVVWLDGRATNGDEGDMQLRSAFFDKSHRSLSDSAVDMRVCECCPTSVAVTADGPVAAYRNRSAGEIRDIYVTRLVAGQWAMPKAVHNDNFKIAGCPINGPAIGARQNDVAVAWFTAPNDDNHSYVAFSHDAGRTFAAPIRVDDVSSLGRMSVAVADDGSAIVGWVEYANAQSAFKVRRVHADGTRLPPVTIAPLSAMRVPRLALGNDEVVLAWAETEKDSSRVKTARIKLTQ